MKRNIVKMSLVTAMLLTTGAYAAQIVGADASDTDHSTDEIIHSLGLVD